MKMSNKIYDILKVIAQYVLPAIATLWLGIAEIWSIPNPELVIATITAIDTFLGTMLGISTHKYNKTKNASDAVEEQMQNNG